MEKKERSAAQRAADKKYREKNPNKERNLTFRFNTPEADEIEAIITASGMSKADFLRRAADLSRQGKF